MVNEAGTCRNDSRHSFVGSIFVEVFRTRWLRFSAYMHHHASLAQDANMSADRSLQPFVTSIDIDGGNTSVNRANPWASWVKLLQDCSGPCEIFTRNISSIVAQSTFNHLLGSVPSTLNPLGSISPLHFPWNRLDSFPPPTLRRICFQVASAEAHAPAAASLSVVAPGGRRKTKENHINLNNQQTGGFKARGRRGVGLDVSLFGSLCFVWMLLRCSCRYTLPSGTPRSGRALEGRDDMSASREWVPVIIFFGWAVLFDGFVLGWRDHFDAFWRCFGCDS